MYEERERHLRPLYSTLYVGIDITPRTEPHTLVHTKFSDMVRIVASKKSVNTNGMVQSIYRRILVDS